MTTTYIIIYEFTKIDTFSEEYRTETFVESVSYAEDRFDVVKKGFEEQVQEWINELYVTSVVPLQVLVFKSEGYNTSYNIGTFGAESCGLKKEYNYESE